MIKSLISPKKEVGQIKDDLGILKKLADISCSYGNLLNTIKSAVARKLISKVEE